MPEEMLSLLDMRELVAQFDEQLNEGAKSFGDFELDRSAKRVYVLEVTMTEDAKTKGKLSIEGVVKTKPIGRVSFLHSAWLETDSAGNTFGTWYDPDQKRLDFDAESNVTSIKEGAKE